MLTPIPLPPPFGGINDKIPLVALESPQCECLLNFNTTQSGVTLRNGDAKYKSITNNGGGSVCTPLRLAKYGETSLFLVTHNGSTSKMEVYDVDAGTIAFTSVITATAPSTLHGPLYFNNRLFLLNGSTHAPGYVYDGASWTTIGWTGSSFMPRGGAVYNNRAYLIQETEAAYWYTNINAISGVVTKIDLSSVITEKSTLSIITPITISDNVSTIDLLAFVFSTGEILFYSGSYPDSTSWALTGRAKISQLLNYDPVLYQGDTLILCDSGVISLRDLFLRGSEAAANLTVNANIQKGWRSLVAAQRLANGIPSGALSSSIRGVWDSATNRIIIQFPGYENTSGAYIREGAFYFIFNTELQSWSHHRSWGQNGTVLPVVDLVSFKNKILNVGYSTTKFMVWQKEGATGFTDRDVNDSAEIGYTYEICSAPVSNGRAFVQRCEGLDVIIESDLYSETDYTLIADLGVQSTTAQKIPDQGTGLRKPNVNTGIEGTYIQYNMSGTTAASKTVGLKLYGINFWQNNGTSPR